jgi:hypothetical protein
LPAAGTDAPIAASPARTLVLPASLFPAGDALQELKVTVACGYISGLRDIPELWDIKLGFDIPSVQLFHATVRLGSAATEGLGSWASSIRIVSIENDCFSVKVVASGRDQEYRWSGAQLHWTR